jgi:hypothetical protein
MNQKQCTYDKAPATADSLPPMCDRHYELWLLTERLKDQRQAVTAESVKALLAGAIANGGKWIITGADVEQLLVGEFARQYQQTEVQA